MWLPSSVALYHTSPLEECTKIMSKAAGRCLMTTHQLHTIVILTTVICSTCHTVSEVEEPSNILQVPIKVSKPHLYLKQNVIE